MFVSEVDGREIALGWDSDRTDYCIGRSSMVRLLRYYCSNGVAVMVLSVGVYCGVSLIIVAVMVLSS